MLKVIFFLMWYFRLIILINFIKKNYLLKRNEGIQKYWSFRKCFILNSKHKYACKHWLKISQLADAMLVLEAMYVKTSQTCAVLSPPVHQWGIAKTATGRQNVSASLVVSNTGNCKQKIHNNYPSELLSFWENYYPLLYFMQMQSKLKLNYVTWLTQLRIHVGVTFTV